MSLAHAARGSSLIVVKHHHRTGAQSTISSWLDVGTTGRRRLPASEWTAREHKRELKAPALHMELWFWIRKLSFEFFLKKKIVAQV
jgi:hypothetical protein